MRKQIINYAEPLTPAPAENWLDLATLARVEVTSETIGYAVEEALVPPGQTEWRASAPGEQTIRLTFDEPQRLQRIHLHFREAEVARTQEFVLRWSAGSGQPWQEIVRQQFNFSPPVTTDEVEDYTVELTGVVVVELIVRPEISGGGRASLAQLRLG